MGDEIGLQHRGAQEWLPVKAVWWLSPTGTGLIVTACLVSIMFSWEVFIALYYSRKKILTRLVLSLPFNPWRN